MVPIPTTSQHSMSQIDKVILNLKMCVITLIILGQHAFDGDKLMDYHNLDQDPKSIGGNKIGEEEDSIWIIRID